MEIARMDDNWNMNGRYRVFSIDKKTWVDVEFTNDTVLVTSNTKKVTLIPHEPLDTYLRRINDKLNNAGKEIVLLKNKMDNIDAQYSRR